MLPVNSVYGVITAALRSAIVELWTRVGKSKPAREAVAGRRLST